MPAHVFHVPQPYRQQEERSSRSRFRWFGDTFRLSSRSRSSSATGRQQQPEERADADDFAMRTSPPKPATHSSSSSTLGRRASTKQPAGHTNQYESDSGLSKRRLPRKRLDERAYESDGYDSLSDTDDASFLRRIGLLRNKLHPTSPSSLNSVHTLATRRPLAPENDDYDSLSESENQDDVFKSVTNKLRVTSPESFNSLRSSTASTASTAVLSDYTSSPSSRSSFDSDIPSPRVEYETRKVLRHVAGLDADWKTDAQADAHYAKLQWRVVRIQADGNCLFRAISDQIYRNEAFHSDMRRRIVDYIDRNRELFQPFVEHEEPGQVEPIDAYCQRMRADGQWGGNPELYAAARLFNVHIVVHQGPLRRLRITNQSKESGATDAPFMELHLLFRNDHYDSLHDETKLDEKARLSLSVDVDVPADHDHARGLTDVGAPSNQCEEVSPAEKPAKKTKRVVFLGEQTRVERVEMPNVELVVPRRAVLRRGRVQSVSGPPPVPSAADPLAEVVVETDSEEEEEEAAEEQRPSLSNQSDDEEPESEVRFATVKRICFRKGRRIE